RGRCMRPDPAWSQGIRRRGAEERSSARFLFSELQSTGFTSSAAWGLAPAGAKPQAALRFCPGSWNYPSDGLIREALVGHRLGVVEITAIENHGPAQQPAHDLEIGVTELLPLGHDGQSVRAFQGAVGTVTVRQAVPVDRAHVRQGFRVVN